MAAPCRPSKRSVRQGCEGGSLICKVNGCRGDCVHGQQSFRSLWNDVKYLYIDRAALLGHLIQQPGKGQSFRSIMTRFLLGWGFFWFPSTLYNSLSLILGLLLFVFNYMLGTLKAGFYALLVKHQCLREGVLPRWNETLHIVHYSDLEGGCLQRLLFCLY